MLIESIIKREGGTHITLGGVRYSFMPDAEGRHVAQIDNPEHAAKLLAIKEGYRAIGDQEAPVEPVSVPATEPAGDEATLQPQDDAEDDGAEAECQSDDEAPAADDRDAWVAKYQEKFGRKPHGKWSIERIRAELEAMG